MTLCVSIPQAVSTIAIAKGSIEDFTKSMVVSIPQAVSTIAIRRCRSSKNSFVDVSIPQAVSTIAIDEAHRSLIAEYAVFQYRKR